ncbi:MAG TPA: hypothetical protein VGK89_01275 [Candidatus Eisenbacteria bacterium]|jgi:hypothetical protein
MKGSSEGPPRDRGGGAPGPGERGLDFSEREPDSARASGTIPRGTDFLCTIRSDRYIELPPELFGPGMDGFRETVTLIGATLFPRIGNTDTIVERLVDGEIGREIPTRHAALSQVSAAPLRLDGHSQAAGYYDLYLTLSPSAESPGRVVYSSRDGIGGTFESQAVLWPLFELRPLGGGPSIFVDAGKAPVPGFPMTLRCRGAAWSRTPDAPNAVRGFRSRGVFTLGEAVWTAKRTEQSAAVRMGGAGDPLARCVAVQAQFPSEAAPARRARINFPNPKEFSNLELG